MLTRIAAALLLGAAATTAQDVDDLLVRARHAQLVQGDLEAAIELYAKALRDTSLTAAREATVRLRLAGCYVRTRQPEKAKGHLAKATFEREGVPASVRRRAAELREAIKESEPRQAARTPVKPGDPEEAKRRQLAETKQRARRYLRAGDLAKASYNVQAALELAPGDEEVKALAAELEARLSGIMDFLEEPLQFVSRWTASRTRAVAREASILLRRASVHASKKEINLAERFFREAWETVDGCEFADDSDELIELRVSIEERWRAMRSKHFGPDKAAPVLPTRTPRASLVTEYLNHLQRMLDLLSSPEREYRIVPITSRRPSDRTRGRVVPKRFTLFEHLGSRWTAARFARLYLPVRVHPESWRRRGNYLEIAGGMLITRNRTAVLDQLQKAVARIEEPEVESLQARFLLVSVPREALSAFARQYGAPAVSERGASPLSQRIVDHSLEHLCSFLRDEGADVRLDRDTFELALRNAAPHALFCGVAVPGAKAVDAPVTATHYGVLLDLFPLRERNGQTAMSLRLLSRRPVTPLGKTPRFAGQEGELFADIPAGSTLVVSGLVDPFSEDRELLLLWRSSSDGQPDAPQPQGVEVPLRNLLLKVRDDPGPAVDPSRGFVRRDRLAVLRSRARFLEGVLRESLQTEEVNVDAEAAVARIPALLRERALALVQALERESARTYVVRVHTRSVRTRVFERWASAEKLRLLPFSGAHMAVREDVDGEFALRRLVMVENDNVFAPTEPWPALTVLGLQAGHVLNTRRRTLPSYATEDDMRKADVRTVEEGTRVTVRPYAWGNRLRAFVDIDVAGLQAQVEERSLSRAVPSYNARVAGTRVSGIVEIGAANGNGTALVCRIPHPTASSPGTLTEIIVAVSIRSAP
ncbi:MAG: tetratricopeptide repeat protein [Planctomycetota bacterium]